MNGRGDNARIKLAAKGKSFFMFGCCMAYKQAATANILAAAGYPPAAKNNRAALNKVLDRQSFFAACLAAMSASIITNVQPSRLKVMK